MAGDYRGLTSTQAQEGVHPAMLPAGEFQGRVQYRQADTVLGLQRRGRVHIAGLAEQEISLVVAAIGVGKTALEYQGHFRTPVSMLGNFTARLDVVKRKLIAGVAGTEIADAQGLGDLFPRQVGKVAPHQALQQSRRLAGHPASPTPH